MLKSLVILFSIFINFLIAQSNVNERYNNRPQYDVNNDGLVDEFGQCGGLDWEGPKACRSNLICFKRSKYYSQFL